MSPLTGVLREAWATYKAFAAHFLLIAFIVYMFASIIWGMLSGIFGVPGNAAAAVIDLFVMFLLQAALVKAVQDVRDGRVDLDLRGTLSAAVPYVLPVTRRVDPGRDRIAIGFVLVIVPGLILLTFWSLIVPSIVIGESPAMASFGRSWRTVRGFAWHVFGTYILVFLILIVVQAVLSVIFSALPHRSQELPVRHRGGHAHLAVHCDRGQPGLLPADRGARWRGPAARLPAVPRGYPGALGGAETGAGDLLGDAGAVR